MKPYGIMVLSFVIRPKYLNMSLVLNTFNCVHQYGTYHLFDQTIIKYYETNFGWCGAKKCSYCLMWRVESENIFILIEMSMKLRLINWLWSNWYVHICLITKRYVAVECLGFAYATRHIMAHLIRNAAIMQALTRTYVYMICIVICKLLLILYVVRFLLIYYMLWSHAYAYIVGHTCYYIHKSTYM